MPQSSISGHPKRSSTSRILATGIVWPPTVQRSSDDRSRWAKFGEAEHVQVHRRHALEHGCAVSFDSRQLLGGVERGNMTSFVPHMNAPWKTTLP